MNTPIDITPIIMAVIALCTVLLTSFVIPKLKSKHPQEEIDKALDQLEVYKNVAMLACRMVEQLYPGMAEKKFNEAYNFMIEYLNKAGIEVNEAQVLAAIESAVLEINKTLRNPAPEDGVELSANAGGAECDDVSTNDCDTDPANWAEM